MSLIRKHGAVLQAWACLALVTLSQVLFSVLVLLLAATQMFHFVTGPRSKLLRVFRRRQIKSVNFSLEAWGRLKMQEGKMRESRLWNANPILRAVVQHGVNRVFLLMLLLLWRTLLL